MASASVAGAQVLQTLSSFNSTNGTSPLVALTLGSDGNFYGTTDGGGTNGGYGTIFKITTSGALTSLFSFNSTNGAYPDAGLTLGNDSTLYGTTDGGGTNEYGTVFKITTNGALTSLISFNVTNGVFPLAALTLGNDGNFYGTTEEGGSSNYGTIFHVTTNATLTTLVSFSGTNGRSPIAALTLANEGNFYGTTEEGGSYGYGTVFKITTNGALTSFNSFNFTNGEFPVGTLTLGNDGNFYGTTFGGGGSNSGTIFQVTTNGTLSTLLSFSGTNGANPHAALILGKDGNFYGTTENGGTYGYGTVFQVTTNGTFTMLVSFQHTNGANPYAALTLGNDGNFYGTTESGGAFGEGTVFRLSLSPLITLSPQSQTNYAGSPVTLITSATSCDPITYQWQKNGTNLVDGAGLSGSTTSTLSIIDITDADAGTYNVVLSNAFGSVTSSNVVLAVDDFAFVASQPQSQTVGVGSNVTFNATFYGESPFVFQWYFNSAPLGEPTTGTGSTSYTLTSVQATQAGDYSVLAINGDGSVMSSNAVLTVEVFPPVITGLQPSNPRVMVSSNVSFGVTVSGTAPFAYQWRFNGGNIVKATNATYTVHGAGATNAGNYSVLVTNSAGSATSSNVWLTVLVPPTLTLQIWAGYPLLNLDGLLSNNFVVQYSTNLAKTNWVNLLSLTNLSASPYLFIDPAGTSLPARYYRALMR